MWVFQRFAETRSKNKSSHERVGQKAEYEIEAPGHGLPVLHTKDTGMLQYCKQCGLPVFTYLN